MTFNRIQDEYLFNNERLLGYVNKFNFPRLSGTQGEKKAVDLTIETFKEIGFNSDQIKSQNFQFSTFYSKFMIKIIIFLNLTFVSIILLIKYLYPFFTFISILILIAIFFSMLKALKYPELKGFWEKNFGKFLEATNVYVNIPANNVSSSKVGNIVVSAHLDSKSQTFKTFWRVIFARIWLYGEITLSISYTIFLIDYHFIKLFNQLILFFEIVILIATILTATSNIILLFLKIGNKSSGSLDNATGMSIVFELSEFFKNHHLNNFNLWFCQFSAEELGTMGSRKFLDSYEKIFLKEYTYQINFDTLSAKNNKKNLIEYIESYGIIPRKKISPILVKYFKRVVKAEKINYKGFHVSLGAHTDSIPFHLRKFDTIDFTTRTAARYAHSTEDTPDKVDPQTLQEACRAVQLLIIALDNNFKNLIESN
ncbi:MAG: M28 family metallopeptidase [Promethearchaeota archaeon]